LEFCFGERHVTGFEIRGECKNGVRLDSMSYNLRKEEVDYA
jgi:hypothetical protein